MRADQHVSSPSPPRLRFAPSPTGALHIGGARTALYNWLLARRSGGTLVLRIEDTDRERSMPENVEQILDALRWLELDWDEGPLSQYERRERHRERMARTGRGGSRVPRPGDRRGRPRLEAAHGGAGYRGEPRDEPGAAIRLRVPDEGVTVVEDLIRGPVRFENRTQDDFVIARGDGTPLYNLAVAVDDAEMEITDVVRGDDHLSNTPKQVLVLSALGARRRRATRTCRSCTGRTGASCRSATAPPRSRSCAPGLPSGRGPQLPRTARLGDRGRHDDPRHRGADRALLDRPGGTLVGDLRRAQAALAERALHARAAAGGVRAATGRSPATRRRGGRGGFRPRGPSGGGRHARSCRTRRRRSTRSGR